MASHAVNYSQFRVNGTGMAREQNFRVEMGERETGPVNLDHFSRRVLSHYVST
jgi:hypothetical protein